RRPIVSSPSVLLTVKIFEACADFLTPDGLGSCRKRRNFGAHRSLVQSCGCGLAALGTSGSKQVVSASTGAKFPDRNGLVVVIGGAWRGASMVILLSRGARARRVGSEKPGE